MWLAILGIVSHRIQNTPIFVAIRRFLRAISQKMDRRVGR
jgi:hypothetical protein